MTRCGSDTAEGCVDLTKSYCPQCSKEEGEGGEGLISFKRPECERGCRVGQFDQQLTSPTQWTPAGAGMSSKCSKGTSVCGLRPRKSTLSALGAHKDIVRLIRRSGHRHSLLRGNPNTSQPRGGSELRGNGGQSRMCTAGTQGMATHETKPVTTIGGAGTQTKCMTPTHEKPGGWTGFPKSYAVQGKGKGLH